MEARKAPNSPQFPSVVRAFELLPIDQESEFVGRPRSGWCCDESSGTRKLQHCRKGDDWKTSVAKSGCCSRHSREQRLDHAFLLHLPPIVTEKLGELQDLAPPFLSIPTLLGKQSRACCMLEHLPNTFICLCRTFKVVSCTNLLLDFLTLQESAISKALPT